MEDKIYYPELDALRFFAFFAVFIHHGPTPLPWFPGFSVINPIGWVGVDLFFCLSAYLFVHLLRVEWQKTGRIQIFYFYIRRALRIWPAYFVYLAGVFLFIYITLGHADKRLLYFYSAGTFTLNIIDAFLGYPPISLTLLLALWTISYEEQFYAIIPWFLRYLFPKSIKQRGLVLGAIFLIGMVIRSMFIAFQVPFPAIYVLPITHFESILGGLCLGLGVFDRTLKRIPFWAAGILGILVLYLTTLMPDYKLDTWWLLLRYPLTGMSMTLLVFMALCSRGTCIGQFFSWRPLVYLGKISYGLYLYHLLAYKISRFMANAIPASFTNIHPGVTNYLIFLSALFLTILIASISYAKLEKPFLKLKKRFTLVQSRPV